MPDDRRILLDGVLLPVPDGFVLTPCDHDDCACPPVEAYHFANGVIMTFASDGHQLPQFTGPAAEVLPRLRRHPECPITLAVWRKESL